MKRFMSWSVVCAVMLTWFSVVSAGEAMDPRQMIQEKESPFATVEETVAAIKKNIESTKGWVINGIKPMDKKIKELGGPHILPVTLIDACNPHYAGAILENDADRYASVMMPCTVSVYQKADGKVYIGYVNARMVGQMFGGGVAKIMGGAVADDQDKFLTLTK